MRCPVMVGREQESALMAEAVAAAVAGCGGRSIFVVGEAGVGKSRLAEVAVECARGAGLAVLRGRAVASSAPIGLRPLTEAVLGGLRRFGVPEAAELDPFRAALGQIAPQYVTPSANGETSAAHDSERRLAIDETLVEVLGLAGETEQALRLGNALVARLSAANVDPRRVAGARLRLARAAVASGRWSDAIAQLDAVDAGDPRPIDVLRAQVAMGEQRADDAAGLARRALDNADGDARPEITCEALEILGRAARLTDLARAESAFTHAYEVADAHGLLLWRVRALHELGTIDLLDWRCDDRRLLAARKAASAIGAVSTVAVVNLQLNAMRLITADLDGALAAITECVDSGRRWGLPLLPKALLHLAATQGLRGRLPEMETAIEQARDVGPDDPEVPAGQYGHARFLLALWQGDDGRALAMLDRAMPIFRTHPGLPTPFRGMWALLHTVQGDGACRRPTRGTSRGWTSMSGGWSPGRRSGTAGANR